MIVSHTHRFIFLRTRKTAGTSLEIALSAFCGPDDVITDLRADEHLRTEAGIRGAQNDRLPPSGFPPWDWTRRLIGKHSYFEHSSARSVRWLLGSTRFNDYYKFAVERNPWDKAISLYYWRTRNRKTQPTLTEYLQKINRKSLSNFHIYSIGGRVVADRVLRFESLPDELESLTDALGLPGRLELPRAKGRWRKDRRDYRDVFDGESRAIVDRVCAREIAHLDYEF
jgi:hypothetical protein